MKIHDVKQGSTEWLTLRAGIPTASEFDNLVSPEWKMRAGQGVDTYLYTKLAEHCMGMPMMSAAGGSFSMEQGTILEGEAIPFYAFTYDVKIDRVGFITTDDGRIGCSPDGLIGDDDGIEIKCPQPNTHLKYLMEGVVPKDYLAQVHGAMFVTGRPKWTFVSYNRQFPPLVIHVKRDEEIQEKLRNALGAFLFKFDEKLAIIKALKAAENAAHA